MTSKLFQSEVFGSESGSFAVSLTSAHDYFYASAYEALSVLPGQKIVINVKV